METKNEKFMRLASARSQSIVEQIRILTNLTNTSNYDYTDEQIATLFKMLEKELRMAKREFNEGLEKIALKKELKK